MKSEMRKELKKLRNSLENIKEKSEIIEDAFLASKLYKDAHAVLLYSSCGSEVLTDKIFYRALQDGKTIAFPRCIDKDGIMEFFAVSDESQLQSDMYGIKAPVESSKRLDVTIGTVCVVPGLSFDKRGFRMGYGKGYYDRFLEDYEGISVGFCFDEMMKESLITDSYDKQVDFIITDKSIFKF